MILYYDVLYMYVLYVCTCTYSICMSYGKIIIGYVCIVLRTIQYYPILHRVMYVHKSTH